MDSTGCALRCPSQRHSLLLQVILLLGTCFLGLSYTWEPAEHELGDVEGDTEGDEETKFAVYTFLWGALRLAATLTCTMLPILIFRQRNIMYVPVSGGSARSPQDNPTPFQNPWQWGLRYHDVEIQSLDGTKLNGWFIYPPAATEGNTTSEDPFTFLFLHSNAGNIGHRLQNFSELRKRLRVGILALEYRGYGDSEDGGGPSERGLVMDAMSAYQWVVEHGRRHGMAAEGDSNVCDRDGRPIPALPINAERVIVFGRSLGGAVAIRLVARIIAGKAVGRAECADLPMPIGLVLENTFTCTADMARRLLPPLTLVAPLLRRPLLLDEWRSADWLETICDSSHTGRLHLCLLSAMHDQIVPARQMARLSRIASVHRTASGHDARFHCFKTGGHMDLPTKGGAAYWQALQTYLEEIRADLHQCQAR